MASRATAQDPPFGGSEHLQNPQFQRRKKYVASTTKIIFLD